MFGRLAEAARVAEDAGFDAISVPDHIYDPAGLAVPMFEAYTALAGGHLVSDAAHAGRPVTLRAPGAPPRR